jgi:predicted ATPase
VVDGVTERAGGVPLFVEEVTRLLLERGEQGGFQAIPPTLQQSLMARLDRLGPAREVAQVGAVIGRDFSYALLHAIAGMGDAPLQMALERLAEADILLVQGLPPESEYRFKHALIQDAAYENLLKSRRQVLHRRVGEVLRDQFAASAAAEPELLAHHFTQAGLIEAAIEWWGKAGQRSLERSALVEGIEQLTRALDQFALLPKTPASRREQIKLQVALISPLIHVKGFAAPEMKAAVEKAKLLIEEAEKLGEHVGDPLLLFTVLYGRWIPHYVAFNGDAVRKLAAQLLALAQNQAEAVPLMIGHRAMGHALLLTGHFVKSRAHYDEALRLYDPAKHGIGAARVGGQDARVAVLVHRARALWLLGYPEAALADAAQAVSHAREIEHAATLMFALNHASVTYVHCGDNDSADALLTELAQLVDKKGAAYWKAFGLMTQGALRLLRGKASDAVHLLTTGLKAYQSTGATVFVPWYLTHLATAYGSLSQCGNAQRMISEAIEAVDSTNERWCEAEVLRTAGEVASLGPEQNSADAQKHFERALAIARQQQAKSWELRAAMSLARLWRDEGKQQQARELLAPVYGWFTEGFDTRDLKEAKALLEEFGS